MRTGRRIWILQFSSYTNFLLVLLAYILPATFSCPTTCTHTSCVCDEYSLFCSEKQLQDILSFEECDGVNRIWLNNNYIKTVKSGHFSAFPDAEYINLASNQIESIDDEAFSELPKLTRLVLTGNKISALPKLHISQVKTLELNDNPVSNIQLSAENLLVLTLAGGKLTTLKNFLSNPSQLTTLDLSNNELKELNSEWFEMAKSLTTLDMSHNQVESLNIDGDNLKKLLTLDLSHNKILKDFDSDVFESMPVLKTLILTGTSVLILSDGPLFSHETLINLSLASCGLTKELPAAAFSELPNLDQLNLSSNNLFGVEGLFNSSTKIRILNLSENNLQSLTSDAFSGALALEELYLNNNAFNSFNLSTISHLSSLQVLDISITPLACSCSEDHWLLEDWTNETGVQFKNTCSGSTCDWDGFSTTTEPQKKCWETFCNKGEKCCSNGVCSEKCSGFAISALPLTFIMGLAMLLTQIGRELV